MIENLMQGIQTLFETDARAAAVTLRKELKLYQWDTAPDNGEVLGAKLEYPFLVWSVAEAGEEEYTFDNNTVDYYQDIIVSFTLASGEKSGGQAQELLALVKGLFRNQQTPLPSGRVLCATIGGGSSGRTPDNNGQTAIVMITFQTGT